MAKERIIIKLIGIIIGMMLALYPILIFVQAESLLDIFIAIYIASLAVGTWIIITLLRKIEESEELLIEKIDFLHNAICYFNDYKKKNGKR